jgi:hypothetical protein
MRENEFYSQIFLVFIEVRATAACWCDCRFDYKAHSGPSHQFFIEVWALGGAGILTERVSSSCRLLDLSQFRNYCFCVKHELCWKSGAITNPGREKAVQEENEQLFLQSGSDVWRRSYFGVGHRKHNSFRDYGIGSVWLTSTLPFGA